MTSDVGPKQGESDIPEPDRVNAASEIIEPGVIESEPVESGPAELREAEIAQIGAEGLNDDAPPVRVRRTSGLRLESVSGHDRGPSQLLGAGALATILGAFSTWSSGNGVTLSGIQGSQNALVSIVFALIALACWRLVRRGSWPGIIAAVLAGIVGLVQTLLNHTSPDLSRSWGWWLSLLGALVLLGAGLWRAFVRVQHREAEPLRRPVGKQWLGIVGIAMAVVASMALQQILVVNEVASWPPQPGAISPANAQVSTEAFVATNPRSHEVSAGYTTATANTVTPWVEGKTFFPKILADIEAAESSVHILMFGWKEGEIGEEFAAMVTKKVAEGIEVRVIVDALGSGPYLGSRSMYQELVDGGVQVVVNDVVPIDSSGVMPNRSPHIRQSEVGAADHRKLFVIDGKTAWIGGAGIEDHFWNGGFHDVMVQVTGDVVLQAQAVFLRSFAANGAGLPTDLGEYFPIQTSSGDIPITIVEVVPGGFVSATQQARHMVDTADERLYITNPYLTDRDMIERIIQASERGVDVQILLSAKSNNFMAQAATRHMYGALLEAGIQLWEYPDAVVHAKVIIADDSVQFGTLNLDAWSLYRDFEVSMVAEGPATADVFVKDLFEPGVAISKPATPPEGFNKVASWLFDKVTWIL